MLCLCGLPGSEAMNRSDLLQGSGCGSDRQRGWINIITALGAEKAIIFISDAHEKFYYEKLKEVRYQDVYHKALVLL